MIGRCDRCGGFVVAEWDLYDLRRTVGKCINCGWDAGPRAAAELEKPEPIVPQGEPHTCEWCGETFYSRRHERRAGRFCSPACGYKGRSHRPKVAAGVGA